jgi:hypothetical protein
VTLQGSGNLYIDEEERSLTALPQGGGITFYAPAGKKFSSIVISAESGDTENLYEGNWDEDTWTGSAESVQIKDISIDSISTITFTLE